MTQREESSGRIPRALIGARVGPYEIVALLGSGGMGEVYKARDRRLDRFVAIFLATRGWALGAAGRVEEAGRVLDELRSRAARDYVSPICFAFVHAGLGDWPVTIERLRQAIEERSPFALWMKVDPIFDQLRGDSEFETLLHSLD